MPHEKRLEWVWENAKGTSVLTIRAFEKMDMFHLIPQEIIVCQVTVDDLKDLRYMLDQIIADYYGGIEA